jgi:hypothetical protein
MSLIYPSDLHFVFAELALLLVLIAGCAGIQHIESRLMLSINCMTFRMRNTVFIVVWYEQSEGLGSRSKGTQISVGKVSVTSNLGCIQ